MDLSVLLSFFLFGSPCCFTRSANPRLVICTISNLSSLISICSPTENFLASRLRMASHILILNPGVDHLDPTFAALVKPKINQVVQPIVDCGDAAFKLQRLCHCRGGDFRQLGSRLKGFLKLVAEWHHAFAVATLADNQKIFFAACAHRFPVYTSASSVKQVKFMGKSIREIPAGWVENSDGSYSKPKGKEILLMMNSAEAKPQLVPSVEKIGITAKSMLDQISGVKEFVVEHEPTPAPRMTKSDKWKRRPRVMRYFDFRDAVQRAAGPVSDVADRIECSFFFTMPSSWSKKKCAEMAGKPHRQRPDADNCLKAVLDALYEEDGAVHETETRKRWCYPGQGRVVVRLITFR